MSDDLHEDDGKTSKLLYKNQQWAVTDYGVESLRSEPYYHFDKTRLLESTDYGSGETYYDWPIHMAEKTWVDIEAFIDVFLKAIEIHAAKADKATLQKSIERARREATRR
jgi:hypothetical protein